ncbi:MAG: hypothetical protein WCE88_04800, partial [Burkholderiales bacterium]
SCPMSFTALRVRTAHPTPVILSDSEESAVTRFKSKAKRRSFAIAQDDILVACAALTPNVVIY